MSSSEQTYNSNNLFLFVSDSLFLRVIDEVGFIHFTSYLIENGLNLNETPVVDSIITKLKEKKFKSAYKFIIQKILFLACKQIKNDIIKIMKESSSCKIKKIINDTITEKELLQIFMYIKSFTKIKDFNDKYTMDIIDAPFALSLKNNEKYNLMFESYLTEEIINRLNLLKKYFGTKLMLYMKIQPICLDCDIYTLVKYHNELIETLMNNLKNIMQLMVASKCVD